MISVIIPNYNHSAYLSERIDSVLCQTYQDIEVILLDDCSTDNSREVLDSYKNHTLVSHVVYNEQNSGCVFRQWERGFSLASGDYIWIAESDYFADPDMLSCVMKVFAQDPDVCLCQVGAQIVDQNSNRMEWDWDYVRGNKTVKLTCGEYIDKFLRWNSFLYNASGIVFRRPKHWSFPQDVKTFRVAGDWFFWLRLLQHYQSVDSQQKIAVVGQKLNRFRRHPTATSAKFHLSETMRIFDTLVGEGYFSGVGKLLQIGVIQRTIKHIEDVEEKHHFQEELKAKYGVSSMLPYHFSQLCKFVNYVSPFCTFPPQRKI